jgi:hypothetical protein
MPVSLKTGVPPNSIVRSRSVGHDAISFINKHGEAISSIGVSPKHPDALTRELCFIERSYITHVLPANRHEQAQVIEQVIAPRIHNVTPPYDPINANCRFHARQIMREASSLLKRPITYRPCTDVVSRSTDNVLANLVLLPVAIGNLDKHPAFILPAGCSLIHFGINAYLPEIRRLLKQII